MAHEFLDGLNVSDSTEYIDGSEDTGIKGNELAAGR